VLPERLSEHSPSAQRPFSVSTPITLFKHNKALKMFDERTLYHRFVMIVNIVTGCFFSVNKKSLLSDLTDALKALHPIA